MIALARIDNRLLHGQILETWVPRLDVRRVVIADDEAAASPLAQAAMTLALPDDVAGTVLPVDGIDYAALAASPEPVLLLFREVSGVSRAVEAGLTPALAPRVNVGNVHYAPGRRPLTPSLFLSRDEVAAVQRLAEAGFEVDARAVPTDPGATPRQLAEKYDAEGEGR